MIAKPSHFAKGRLYLPYPETQPNTGKGKEWLTGQIAYH